MDQASMKEVWKSMSKLLRSHPWHGIPIGEKAPEIVNTYIETVPTDTVKYEIDKQSGFLKADRPHKYSSICPTLYGFIPQTYCGELIGEYCSKFTGRPDIEGDGDPLDICILSEKTISHGDIMVRAIPIGGFRMIDQGQADDKIIAVMKDDALYKQWSDISDCPEGFLDRLKHYFVTYKELPTTTDPICEITHIYGRAEAFEVIRRSREDYKNKFSEISSFMNDLE
ncbi:MAG: inorganic pyrophosphatase [Lysobacterales bacterium]|jgi:inorganic pyrophosphatase